MNLYKETTGYIIHQRNFKDSSLILEFFSRDHGKLQFIAKGIKKNKRQKTQAQYFSLIKIQYYGQSQLKTVTAMDIIEEISHQSLIENTAGLYLNELLHYSLLENDKDHDLFQCYQHVIRRLGQEKLTPLLRLFEQQLLKYNGFELNVESYKDTNAWLTINDDFGLTVTTKNTEKICQVKNLKDFTQGIKLDKQSQKNLNKLMYKAIDLSLNYKRIYARELLKFITR